MSTAQIVDGKQLGRLRREEVRVAAQAFAAQHGRAPGLHVILVGEDPASVVYTRNKERAAAEAGLAGVLHRLPADTSQAELLALLRRLNDDPAVDGILVQLPLPAQIDAEPVLRAIDPRKDVDGFHPENVGLLALGSPRFAPCTPQGCMRLLAHTGVSLRGAHAVVLGRSAIVGKPMALLLLQADATVTIAHSRTRDLPTLCRSADVLVAAVGRPELVRGDWIQPGAVVIDVGINRVAAPRDGEPTASRLVGDVHFAEASARAGWITPVPGGVGPMTIAELLGNTVRAAELRMAQP